MGRLVTDYLLSTAEAFPEKTAFVDDKKSLSFGELITLSKRVSYELEIRGLFKKPIAVMTSKSVNAIVSFCGVMLSGNYYTVIDEKMPDERIKKLFDTFCPEIILFDNALEKKVNEYSEKYLCINIESLSDTETVDTYAFEQINRIIDTDILYVLFTSGSTGTPKGVIISHRSVIDYIDWACDTFLFDENTVFGNQAPFYFDNSVLDIYSTLKCGGTMCIIPRVCFSFPIKLLEYVRDKGINTVFWVPTVLIRVANLDILDKCDISCMKKVLFAGEIMPNKQLNIWRRALPKAMFANLYGPTEITVDCTYFIVDREFADDEPLPIGKPCKNSDVIVLNEDGSLVQGDEKGELCVRGTSLALGYYNNPEKTKEAFVQNPLNHSYEEKIYKTGDIVHYNERGELIFDGRNDSQIKHSGHRIELGEIETAISSIEGVEMNCCLHDENTDQLYLFYTGRVDEKTVKTEAKNHLPDYMIPGVIKNLKTMPMNLNGKIDRIGLKEEMEEYGNE